MARANALILLAGTPVLDRTQRDDFFSLMPWNDLDALYHCMLEDMVELAMECRFADTYLFRESSDQSDDFLGPYLSHIRLKELQGASSSEQIRYALEVVKAGGYLRAIVIPEVNPLVGRERLSMAFSMLTHEDDCVVLGPTEDQRWYLLGVKAAQFETHNGDGHSLFESPADVLKYITSLDLLLFEADTLYRLDTPQNLHRLQATLEADAGPSESRTLKMLHVLEKKYKRKAAR